MTALKNHAKILKLYNESRTNYLKLIFIDQSLSYSWQPWLITIGLIVLLAQHSFQPESPQQILFTLIGTTFSVLGLFLTVEKARAKKFKKLYKKHNIKSHPALNRQELIRYTIFLKKLKKHEYSESRIDECIASIRSCIPPETTPATQNILITTLVTALIAITVSLLEKNASWTSEKGVTLILAMSAMLYISGIVITILKNRKAQTLTIIKLLERAKLDLYD